MKYLLVLGLFFWGFQTMVFAAQKPKGTLIATVACPEEGVDRRLEGLKIHFFKIDGEEEKVQVFIDAKRETHVRQRRVTRVVVGRVEGGRAYTTFVQEETQQEYACGPPPMLLVIDKVTSSVNEVFALGPFADECDEGMTALAVEHDLGAKTATVHAPAKDDAQCDWVPAAKK